MSINYTRKSGQFPSITVGGDLLFEYLNVPTVQFSSVSALILRLVYLRIPPWIFMSMRVFLPFDWSKNIKSFL